MKDILVEEDYLKILRRKYRSKNLQFVNAEWEELSDIEGFLGDHFFLSINFKENNQLKTGKFFIKTKPRKTEVAKTTIGRYFIYRKESFIYDFLMKQFEDLGYLTDFAVKCFLCKNEETIVMDDLNSNGFELCERGKYFDLDHCKLGLEALAKYHANGISYEEEKSKKLGRPYRLSEEDPKIFAECFYILGEDCGSYQYLKSSKDVFLEVSKIMPELEEWKKSFQERMEKVDLAEIFWKDFPYRKTVGHGDLWSNNMMFKYQKDIPVEVCLLDFQLLRYFHPSFDSLLLLYCNTGSDFRQKHMKDLLDYYYDCFVKILARNGYDASILYPKTHFLEVAEALKFVACFQGAASRTVTLIPKDITSDTVNGGDLEKFFYEDQRTKLVLLACKNDEGFRKIIFDDIYEMEKLL